MELKELLEHFNNGDTLGEDFEVIELMRYYSRQAQKITMQINTQYHELEELASLFSELIGKPVGEGFGLFPPFYTDFGKNITIGRNVFINAGCKFQDQSGITIDEGTASCWQPWIMILHRKRDSSFIRRRSISANASGSVRMPS